MQPIIKDIILSISDDVVSNLTQSFEKTYYGKMNYSSKNTILDSDNKLLKETIGFEIAFIHVITYFLAYSMSCSHEYMHILNILDTDKLFSWFKIKDNSMFLQLNDCNIPTEKEIYELINEHDKFIDKDVKKKLGQFYADDPNNPITIGYGKITPEKRSFTFSNLSSAHRYRITCDGNEELILTITDGRNVSFFGSMKNVFNMISEMILF